MNQTTSDANITPSLSPDAMGDGDTSNNDNLGAQLSAMSIGIIVLCALFGLALIIAIWLLFMRRKRHKLTTEDSHHHHHQHQQTTTTTPSSGGVMVQGEQGAGGGSLKKRIKEHLWHHDRQDKKQQQQHSLPTVDDLVFSAIQQHLPPHPPPPTCHQQQPTSDHHRYSQPDYHHHHHHHPQQHEGATAGMFEEGYSYSTLRGTSTAASHCSKSLPDDPILQSLARQREVDRAGYYKSRTCAIDKDEEAAMLQRLSMSSYHVW
ncbi:hypothetical protein O0I10_010064 [Lichtheimia ornata]|uniref:Uncharacterized protein n=1 Tax=Lichtheimia ornata TaxID=688661 RepID=A0AAD7UX24_9FUNG|nr:uncharacterized protein O0I10_010064 [Lichtheimia ornata]KAJ8654242.1 hypothetical protein O0I10_010064 [Lichtheimia ornata]